MNHITPARFTRLATAALAAALLALGALPAARAQIVYTAPVDLTLTTAASNGGAYLVFGFGTSGSGGSARIDNDFNFRPGDQFYFTASEYPDFVAAGVFQTTANYDSERDAHGFSPNLSLGAPIDGSHASFGGAALIYLNDSNDANWAPGSSGYLGFSFIDGAVTDYGWARVSFNADFSVTLHDFAYEASGASILAGDTGVSAIPEPSTYAAFVGLIAGAVALNNRRRRLTPSAA
jgi:hypothetical protein